MYNEMVMGVAVVSVSVLGLVVVLLSMVGTSVNAVMVGVLECP